MQTINWLINQSPYLDNCLLPLAFAFRLSHYGHNDNMSLCLYLPSTDHDKPHFDLFFLPQYQRQRKCFSSERELEKVLRDILTRAAWYGLLFTTAN